MSLPVLADGGAFRGSEGRWHPPYEGYERLDRCSMLVCMAFDRKSDDEWMCTHPTGNGQWELRWQTAAGRDREALYDELRDGEYHDASSFGCERI